MRTNVMNAPTTVTHEGGPARRITPEEQLRRLVMSCMLWEDTFYVDGKTVADQICEAVTNVPADVAANIAIEARTKGNLRHAPLLVVREMFRDPAKRIAAAATLYEVIQRADEMGEWIALYWQNGRKPLPAGAKRAIASCFEKFSGYQLAKYNGDAKVKMRDVLRLCHPKPLDEAQSALWKSIIDGTIQSPDTWEVALSSGEGKKTNEEKRAEFERLLNEKKLGALALLRNLRNCLEWGVDLDLLRSSIGAMDTSRVLPFRFIAAAKHAPKLEPFLEVPMLASAKALPKLKGRTALLVDVSGSMDQANVSGRSQMTRMDAACALAILAREMCDDVDVVSFSTGPRVVPARRGFALRDAIVASQPHGGTMLGASLASLHAGYDRIIVLTDEQAHDTVQTPKCGARYMINVAPYKNGVGYGPWVHIDGFSSATLDFIAALEG